MDDLGTAEIAMLLKVSRAHAVNVIIKRPDFPKPYINLSQRIKRWRRADVISWVAKTSK